jgi:MFS family permease
LAQLIFSPIWGGFSDKVGRRPIMLMSTLGAVFAYILFALSHSLEVLFLSRLIAGVMGGNISTAQAYVADITEHKDRAKGMGLIGAAFGIGFVIGPALATLLIHPVFHETFAKSGMNGLAVLIEQNKYAVPGFVAAFFSMISFLLVMFKLPESLNTKVSADGDRITRSSVFSKTFWVSLTKSSGAKNTVLPLLMVCMLLLSFGQSSLYSAFPLFCNKMLGLSAEKVGMQFVYMGLVAVFIQGGMIRPLEKRFGEKNYSFWEAS